MSERDSDDEENPPKRTREINPPQGNTWANAVLIPSQPIKVPQAVGQPVHPLIGNPNDTFFDQVMRNTWEPKPLLSTDGVGSIREDPPVLHIPSEDEAEEREEHPPPVSGNHPKVDTGPHVGLDLRIREILRNRNGPLARIRAPNLVLRLAFVLGLISRPGVIMDTLVVPPVLYNPLEMTLTRLHQEKVAGRDLTPHDLKLYELYKGFLYLKNIVRINVALAVKRYKSSVPDGELEIYQPWFVKHPYFCPNCQVIHAYTVKEHPQSCIRLYSNGPRRISDLKRDLSWKYSAKAIIVGNNGLIYLPPYLRNTHINIGSIQDWDYSVPTSADNIFQNCQTHESSLIKRIERIIELVGAGSHLPIFVEFYENSNYNQANIALHVCGFAHAIRHCQYLYAGPIIMIIGPVMAREGETESSYQRKKAVLGFLQKASHYIGNALGVPIVHVPMQSTEILPSGETVQYHYFGLEPIFSSKGIPTREFYHRLQFWFEHATKYIYEGLPKPTGRVIPGQERRMEYEPLPHFV
jgi:hypothetical protein